MSMRIDRRLPIVILIALVAVTIGSTGCATKKYVRKTVNERVTPLEGRTQELEETTRRNTQDIRTTDDRLTKQIADVSGRTDRAQASADSANSRAIAADERASRADEHAAKAEERVEDLRSNLDRYTPVTTASINFKVNSSVLTEDGRAQLDNLAQEAKNHKGYLLEIQGFTDSSGNNKVNEKLSQARAETVQRYLAREHQIPIYKMSILGLGELEEEPVERTRRARREARLRNRRVDVQLLVNNAVNSGNTQSTTPLRP
jgi:outer membrane protein OmpA-like peptidoglycan-associated protein